MVIDLFGLDSDEVRTRFPEVYQHLLETVKLEREATFERSGVKDSGNYARLWWLFAKARQEMRRAIAPLSRYIATVQTAKHRVFQFLDARILPDIKIIVVAGEDAFDLGVLSSKAHVAWSLKSGGALEDRPVYAISQCFDPFPFPTPDFSLRAKIRDGAEELDALRKRQQADHPGLTLTQIYNVLEKLRARAPLDETDEAIKTKGLVLIVRELHDEIDRLVAQAYGWPADLSDDEILARLVALNAERAREEKRGLIRWLRPDYQRQRAGLGDTRDEAAAEEQIEAKLDFAEAKTQKPLFPTGDLERTATVFAALMQANAPLDAAGLARSFRQGAKVEPAVSRVLASLARLGHAHSLDGRTFALRRVA